MKGSCDGRGLPGHGKQKHWYSMVKEFWYGSCPIYRHYPEAEVRERFLFPEHIPLANEQAGNPNNHSGKFPVDVPFLFYSPALHWEQKGTDRSISDH